MTKRMKLLIVSAVLIGLLLIAASTQVDLTFQVKNILPAANGGTGFNGGAAANGSLPIGNGSGFTNATITAGTNMTVVNGAGAITLNSTSGSGTTPTQLTFNSTPVTLCNVSVFPQNGGGTAALGAGHGFHIVVNTFKASASGGCCSTSNANQIFFSKDATHAFQFFLDGSATGAGNVSTYNCTGASNTLMSSPITGFNNNYIGWYRLEGNVLAGSGPSNYAWTTSDGLAGSNHFASLDTSMDVTTGTWSVYVYTNAIGSVGPAYIETF